MIVAGTSNGNQLRTWLRIAHCSILVVVTIPRAVNSAIGRFPGSNLVDEALGGSRNLTVSQLELAFPIHV